MPRKKSSPAVEEVFRNLLRTKWPMAPDTPPVINHGRGEARHHAGMPEVASTGPPERPRPANCCSP